MSSEPENIQNANNDVTKEKINETKTDNSQEEKPNTESVQKSNAMDNDKDSPVENDTVSNSKESNDNNEKSNSVKAEENDTKEKLEQVKEEESENENDKTVSSNDSADVKKEDQDDDADDKHDTEDTEATEEESDKKKDVPLLDQPLEKSGTRERKKVQRFNEEFNATEREAPKLEIPEGSGQQLGEIPRVDASISRFKTDDLKHLHRILFKTQGKTTQIKKNIKKFNGFDFSKDSEQYQKKLHYVQKLELKLLKSICEMLDLEKKGNRDEIGQRICEFLIDPRDSGKPVTGGRPKRSAAIKANNRGYSSHEDFSDDDGPPSKRPQRAIRGKGKRPNLKDESSSNESGGEGGKASESENVIKKRLAHSFEKEGVSSAEEMPKVLSRSGRGRAKTVVKKIKKDSDSEEFEESDGETTEEDSDEPKSKRRRSTSTTKSTNNKSKRGPAKKSSKSTPKKSPAQSKSKKATQDNKRGKGRRPATKRDESSNEDSEEEEKASSSEDEPLMKKSKSPQPPTDEEIKSYVKEILEGANLEEITMKTVCKQVYAHYPDFDLAHKKDFIKTTVKSLIST